VAVSPLRVVSAAEDWVGETTAFLVRRNLRDGMFFQKIVHTGLNPYLSAQLARVLFLRGDPLGHAIVRALLRHASPTLTWPEALHPRSLGGCMGDGDHGWAAAEFLNLIREMLLETADGELRLAPHLPAEWLKPGLDLRVEEAPSLFGTVTYSLRWTARGLEADWTVRRRPHQDSGTPVLALPEGWEPPPNFEARGQGALRRVVLPGDQGHVEFSPPPARAGSPETVPTPILSTQESA
jgi:hypothetical protein